MVLLLPPPPDIMTPGGGGTIRGGRGIPWWGPNPNIGIIIIPPKASCHEPNPTESSEEAEGRRGKGICMGKGIGIGKGRRPPPGN